MTSLFKNTAENVARHNHIANISGSSAQCPENILTVADTMEIKLTRTWDLLQSAGIYVQLQLMNQENNTEFLFEVFSPQYKLL